jgi:membrane protein implicated in regulation of membrane protease activity
MELDVGKKAVVIEEINNSIGKGRVKLSGVDWKAVSDDDSVIAKDSIVTVQEVNGSKLIVTLSKEKVNS